MRRLYVSWMKPLLRGINWEIVLLAVLTVAAGYPFLKWVFPIHDTQCAFHTFHYFYSDWLYNGELPQWSAYAKYGFPVAYHQAAGLSPACYLVMAVGKPLHVANVLRLFRLALLLETLAYGLGVYLVARRLFTRRTVVFVVCLGAVAGCCWFYQIWFNFRIFYLFPYIYYFLLLFFERRQARFFWLAGVVALVNQIGNPPYFVIVELFVTAVVGLVFLMKDWKVLGRLLSRSPLDVAALTAFVLLAAVVGYFVVHSLDGVVVNSPNRDPVTGRNSLDTFLSYGGVPNAAELVRRYVLGLPVLNEDNTYYIGLLPLLGFLWALVKVRNRAFAALAAAAVALFWLSLGGVFAVAAFRLPGMGYYRYLGLLNGLVGLLVLLASGFGLEDFLQSARRTHLAVAGLLFLAIGDFWGADFYKALAAGAATVPDKWFIARATLYAAVFLVPAAGLGLWRLFARRKVDFSPAAAAAGRRWLAAALAAAFLVDVGSFRYDCVREYGRERVDEQLTATLAACPLEYQEQRIPEEQAAGRQARAVAFINRRTQFLFGSCYDWAHLEPYWPKYNVYLYSRYLQDLCDGRGWTWPDGQKDAAFLKVLGCTAPKMRWVDKAEYAGSVEEARQRIRSAADLDRVVVLRGNEPAEAAPAGDAAGDMNAAARFRVTHFTPNRVVVDADVAPGKSGWLVYADCYSPAWHAKIDGRPVPVEEAYLAFKAVRLGPGRHVVRFWYDAGWETICSYLIAGIGAAVCLFFLAVFTVLVFRPIRSCAALSQAAEEPRPPMPLPFGGRSDAPDLAPRKTA